MCIFTNVSHCKICSFFSLLENIFSIKKHKVKFMIFEYFPVQRYHTHKYLWYFCTDSDDKQ